MSSHKLDPVYKILSATKVLAIFISFISIVDVIYKLSNLIKSLFASYTWTD